MNSHIVFYRCSEGVTEKKRSTNIASNVRFGVEDLESKVISKTTGAIAIDKETLFETIYKSCISSYLRIKGLHHLESFGAEKFRTIL
jgi:hypothetical protein